jgi:molybdate transport system regulatory protein
MKISARNILAGTVSHVLKGAVNSEVEVSLAGGEKIVAVITNASVEFLGLTEGVVACAIVKANEVIIGKGLDGAKFSARNVLNGVVEKVDDGAVNSEVVLVLGGGEKLVASITKASVQALGLASGDAASAIIKASNVLIGV